MMRKTIGWLYYLLLVALLAFAVCRVVTVQRDLREAEEKLGILQETTDRLLRENELISSRQE